MVKTTMQEHEIIIIGAGVIGLSIAVHLVQKGAKDILVFEEREAAGIGTTAKATGGIRHQFSSEINIKCTIESMEEILNFAKFFGIDLHFKPLGYLLLAANFAAEEDLKKSVKMQQDLGVQIQLMSPLEISKFIPDLNTTDIKLGSFCPQDGVADPYAMVSGYESFLRRRNIFIKTNIKITRLEPKANKIQVNSKDQSWLAQKLIIATGPYSLDLLSPFAINFPIIPHRKQVFFVTSPPSLRRDLPLVIEFPSGWYFRYDAGLLALGMSMAEDKAIADESVDLSFAPIIIEHGLNRLPTLSSSSLVRGLAGLSDSTPDNHCILDKLSQIGEVYLALGFSGHGFQHAPVIGKLMAELILEGKTKTLDIMPFRWKRFKEEETLFKEVFVVA